MSGSRHTQRRESETTGRKELELRGESSGANTSRGGSDRIVARDVVFQRIHGILGYR